eukprot:jgi/Ulvmu1/10556/UM065_0010.1
MLDINVFREEKGGNPDLVRESQKRRYADVNAVNKVIELDRRWREALFKMENVKKEINVISKEIGRKMKAKEDAADLKQQSVALKESLIEAEADVKLAAEERDSAIAPIGNLVHDSVPIDDDEEHNTVVKAVGKSEKGPQHKYNHVDLVQLLGIVDLDAGTKVAGARGFFLKGAGVLLNQALINCALQFAYKRGYEPLQTPFFMRKSIMAECAQLSQFDEELYHVSGEGEDKYLIATSEQPLCAMMRGTWLEPEKLPQRYVGYSTCFRKEAGAHGRDTLGIFRIHQFEKVEQFVVCSPDDGQSWELMDEMLGNAEAFYQALGIPYRVVNIVSGALNDAAAKKYDLEAFFPGANPPAFRELVSCSNCTDYQSRNLEVRVRMPKIAGQPERKAYAHLLNSTLSATERTLCCVLENYQTQDGVNVPEALQPFMMGIAFIPFKFEYDLKGRLVPRKQDTADSASMSTS